MDVGNGCGLSREFCDRPSPLMVVNGWLCHGHVTRVWFVGPNLYEAP